VAKEGEAVVSALRSAITKSKSSVRVIFTGSNQDRLRELFSRSHAALYEGASLSDRTERAFTDESFKPLYEGLTTLQQAILR
jgi:hypothetical protein